MLPAYAIVLICIGATAALVIAALFALAALIQVKMFGHRFDKDPRLKYFSAQDFGLTARDVERRSFGVMLRGFIYSDRPLKECRALVIFCHGMGPGQCSYTTEIAYFCKRGYAVLALDSCGCGLSEGKAPKGLEAGISSAVAAFNLAKEIEELKNFKAIFAGHSMGGYASLCAAALCKADGAIAFAAPETPSLTVCNSAARIIFRPLAAAILPFLMAFARLYIGSYANTRASKALKNSGAPAIIFQGDKDITVPLEFSAYSFCDGFAQRVLCSGKGHNPYNTERAEKLLAELCAAIANPQKISEEDLAAYFSSVDYDAVCEEDISVMSAAAEFIEAILSQSN